MAGIKFDVQVDIPLKPLVQAASRAEHILAIQVAKDTAPYVPALTSSLSIKTRVDGGTIIYPGPYAHYLYNGKVFVDPETRSPFAPEGTTKVETNQKLVFTQTVHPLAQSKWFEASKLANLERWDRVAGKAIKRELKLK